MANITRTMADTAGFIPQAWARRALTILRSNMVLAQFVRRDFDFAALHPYSATIPELDYQLEKVRGERVAGGAGRKPLIVTEFGVASGLRTSFRKPLLDAAEAAKADLISGK